MEGMGLIVDDDVGKKLKGDVTQGVDGAVGSTRDGES
jgi:hypothetical protein